MSDDVTNWGVLLYRLDAQEREITSLREHVVSLERKAEARDTERTAQERRYLIAGIMFLGGTVSMLGTLIWSYRSVIFGDS